MKIEKNLEIQFLRAIAILMVVIYHFFCRQSSLLSFQNFFNVFPLKYFWLGVHLFFIISGFVISLSLQKTPKLKVFLKNRIFKIYPPLIVILPLVYISQLFIPFSPYKHLSNIVNLLFSVLMFPPNILNLTISTQFNWVTLVLWPLKVEIIFYLVFSILYYKTRKANLFLVLLFLGNFANLNFAIDKSSTAILINRISDACGLNYFVFFYVGNLLFQAKSSYVTNTKLYVFEFVSMVHVYYLYTNFSVLVIYVFLILLCNFFILFYLGFKSLPKYLLNVADSSYEMYLCHQGIGVTLTIYATNQLNLGKISCILLVILMILLMSLLSNIIFKYLSNPINIYLKRKLSYIL